VRAPGFRPWALAFCSYAFGFQAGLFGFPGLNAKALAPAFAVPGLNLEHDRNPVPAYTASTVILLRGLEYWHHFGNERAKIEV